jgi:hypothetical protein
MAPISAFAPPSAAVVIDVKTVTADSLQNFA